MQKILALVLVLLLGLSLPFTLIAYANGEEDDDECGNHAVEKHPKHTKHEKGEGHEKHARHEKHECPIIEPIVEPPSPPSPSPSSRGGSSSPSTSVTYAPAPTSTSSEIASQLVGLEANTDSIQTIYYDSSGRVAFVSDPRGHIVSWQALMAGLVAALHDPFSPTGWSYFNIFS